MKYSNINIHFITIILSATYFLLIGVIFPKYDWPDFDSYEYIYNLGGFDSVDGLRDPLFVVLVQLSLIGGLDYYEFRAIVKALSLLLLVSTSILMLRVCGKSTIDTKPTLIKIAYVLILFFSLYWFYIEYFEVRIRAGLTIAFIFHAFSVYVFYLKNQNKWLIPYICTVVLISCGMHLWTAVIVIYYFALPFLFMHIWRAVQNKCSATIYLYCVFIVGVIINASALAALPGSVEELRGSHLLSPLNPVRFAFYSILPFGFVLSASIIYAYLYRRHLPFNIMSRTRKYYDYSFASRWSSFSFVLYLSLAFALSVLFISGYTDVSGEAIVRLVSLYSAVFILNMAISTSVYALFCLLWLLGNALFFIVTLGYFS
jgi:hypothetical protein